MAPELIPDSIYNDCRRLGTARDNYQMKMVVKVGVAAAAEAP
jgi:hypothetical protein